MNLYYITATDPDADDNFDLLVAETDPALAVRRWQKYYDFGWGEDQDQIFRGGVISPRIPGIALHLRYTDFARVWQVNQEPGKRGVLTWGAPETADHAGQMTLVGYVEP